MSNFTYSFFNSDEKRHKEAAAILTEYLNECGEEAVEVLTEGLERVLMGELGRS